MFCSDGSVYSWGQNLQGQLGIGSSTFTDYRYPVAVTGFPIGTVITHVAAAHHTIALASDGTLFGWGSNTNGALGDGTGTDRPSPVAVQGIGKIVTKIAVGDSFSMALAMDGTAYGWGNNLQGQIGNGNMNLSVKIPVPVMTGGLLSGKPFTEVSCGDGFTVVLSTDGNVYGWGDNSYGQLGSSDTGNKVNPVQILQSGTLHFTWLIIVHPNRNMQFNR